MKRTPEDIIRILIDVVNQSCQAEVDNKKIYCSTMGLSAYEDAFDILEIEGYARKIKVGKHKNKYELRWKPHWVDL